MYVFLAAGVAVNVAYHILDKVENVDCLEIRDETD